jgi:hypothetical protein
LKFTPQVLQGDAEKRCQLFLLILGGGLPSGFKFLHRHPGQAQSGGEGGPAEALFRPQLLNAPRHCHHGFILLCL